MFIWSVRVGCKFLADRGESVKYQTSIPKHFLRFLNYLKHTCGPSLSVNFKIMITCTVFCKQTNKSVFFVHNLKQTYIDLFVLLGIS